MIWRAFWKDTRGVKFVQHEFGCGWIRCWHQVVSLMRSRLAAVSRGRLCHGAKTSSYMKTVFRQKPHFEKWSNTHLEKLYQSLTYKTNMKIRLSLCLTPRGVEKTLQYNHRLLSKRIHCWSTCSPGDHSSRCLCLKVKVLLTGEWHLIYRPTPFMNIKSFDVRVK